MKNFKIEAPCPVDIHERPHSANSRHVKDKPSMMKIAEEYYDDEEGNYKGIRGDHIGYRYEVLSLLGNGSFGNVFKCFDHKTQKECALKMLWCFKEDKN